MKKAEVEALWKEVFSDSAELEAFEAGLTGLTDKLINALNDELPSTWIEHVRFRLKSEPVLTLAVKLNRIAGLYYSVRELKNAKAVCEWALALYTAVLGADHQDTKVIAANLQTLQESMSKYRAVSLSKRSRKQE